MQPVTQGGTYKISALVRTLPNTNGTFYLRYVYSGTPKGTQTYVLGTVEGVAVPQQWTEYSWEFTPPAGARYVSPTVVLNFGGTAGDMECQSIRIREMLDSSMVVQGGLSADRISTPKLSALSSILGSVEIDASGYLRGGQTAYSTGNGFWFGYSGGAYKASMKSPAGNGFTFDGTDMVLKGKFTADAIDAVDTLNIKGQSITVPLYATMSLENTNYSGPYSKTLTLPSVNLYGSLQVIHLYVKFYVDTGGAVPSSTTFSLTRGGTTVFSKTFPAYNNAESPYIDFLIDEFFSDNPGTGNVQYTISMSHVGTYGVGVARIVISGARR
jgi:hypothetical protein